METMLSNTAGSGINKSQTQTIKNIKVVYHVPTPFSSVVCYKEKSIIEWNTVLVKLSKTFSI